MPPTVVQPRFMARFSCLGADCPDNCCGSFWAVDIDAATERKFREEAPPEWRERFLSALVRVPAGDGRRRRLLRMPPGGFCPFLGEDRLCTIHGTLGEDFLSHTCRVFPRLVSGSRELVLRTGSVACVQVARELLDCADALEQAVEGDPLAVLAPRPARGVPPGELTVAERARIRALAVAILGARRPWPDRVAMFAVFLEDLGRLDTGDGEAADRLAAGWQEALDRLPEGALAESFAPSPELAAGLAAVLVRRIFARAGGRDARGRLLIDALLALRAREGEEAGDAAGLWQRVVRERIAPELEARPHARGNVVAALLMQAGLPPAEPKAAQEAAWTAAITFALWQIVLAGRLVRGAPFDDAAARSLWLLGRFLMHNRHVTADLRRTLETHGLATLPALAALLR